MKLWVLFTMGSFMLGVLLWRRSEGIRMMVVAGLCLFVCIGYFFLHQI
jgi:hypothetical protein